MTAQQPEPRPPVRVLIVDDEKNIRRTLRFCLEGLGAHVQEATSAAEAIEQCASSNFALIFLDLRLGTDDGLVLLERLVVSAPGAAIVVVTAYATIDTAVTAMKRGAFDYLPKPFTPAQIETVLTRVTASRRLQARVSELEERLDRETGPAFEARTSSPTMRAALDAVERVAAHNVVLLIRGESGTGKSLMAHHLHTCSPRSEGPFVVVNCPTLSEELLASELFGHAKGAFTGAVRDQAGRVESAQSGTLFLDEIGELSIGLQAKLLRFLQDHQFERVGENRTRTADVRVVCATNRNLEADVAAGRFREDLLYRINAVEVRVPSLRERREDIPALVASLVERFARASGQVPPTVPAKVMDALVAHPWPGNVRELKNAMERAVIFSAGGPLRIEDLPGRVTANDASGGTAATAAGPSVGGDYTLTQIESEHIQRVLARAPTQEEAARILGIDPSTLWRRKKKRDDG